MDPKKLVRKILPSGAIKGAEEAYRKGRIYALQAKEGFPAKGMKVIAVTGTNGKTTTCLYINEMLKSAGYKTAMFTTALSEVAGVAKANTIHRTVPLTGDLLKFFRAAKKKKVDFVVLEVTSQALDQHKLIGTPIEVAVMTNLTQDHLDYHKTMEVYAAAKARLFNDYLGPKSVVLNHDDEWFDYFAKQSVVIPLTYGVNAKSSVRLKEITSSARGSEVVAEYKQHPLAFRTSLIGEFNAYNASAAVATGIALGITPEKVASGVAALTAVPGRMEQVSAGQEFSVLVDYAHTPDALKNVLTTLQKVTKGRVVVVFGATGDRDKAKRPLMGEVAAKNADYIYLTDDETYTEDPAAIRAAVMKGITRGRGAAKTTEIGDRRKAIAAAFKQAQKGDVVLLAGIGHQDYRAMGGKNVPWDERDIAREELGKI